MIPRRLTFTLFDLAVFGGAGALVLWFFHIAGAHANYTWKWNVIGQYLVRMDAQTGQWVPGMLLGGLFTTLRISCWALIMALILGLIMALFRTGSNRMLNILGTGYVALIRNIPVLIWIFIAYYFIGDRIIPVLGLDNLAGLDQGSLGTLVHVFIGNPAHLPVFVAGTVALAVYEGAYVTEIIRAGIGSVDSGQWEASWALGFSRLQQMRHIILPQALKNVLPPLAGQVISTIKDSAIVSIISIQELTFQGMELMSATFLTFEIWIIVMALYFLLCFSCSLVVGHIEGSLQKKQSGR
ncbi:MAG: amino acid ABC transporter permease [Pseudomonadota bacterium]